MKDCHSGNVMESCIPIWFMLQKTSKKNLINFFQNFPHFLVEWLNIHGILSLFHISKHDLALRLTTQDMTMSFMVPIVYPIVIVPTYNSCKDNKRYPRPNNELRWIQLWMLTTSFKFCKKPNFTLPWMLFPHLFKHKEQWQGVISWLQPIPCCNL